MLYNLQVIISPSWESPITRILACWHTEALIYTLLPDISWLHVLTRILYRRHVITSLLRKIKHSMQEFSHVHRPLSSWRSQFVRAERTCVFIAQNLSHATVNQRPWEQGTWDHNGAHLGPKGPRWAHDGPMNLAIWTSWTHFASGSPIDNKSSLVQACTTNVSSHYLNQRWHRYKTPYDTIFITEKSLAITKKFAIFTTHYRFH